MQLQELEHVQILEQGTVSLPAMRNFWQELLKKPSQHGTKAHGKSGRFEHAVQLEELERGQILERGTVSLPAMRDFRHELLKGASWHASEAPPAPAEDLTGLRRPGGTPSSDRAPVSSCCNGLFHSFTDLKLTLQSTISRPSSCSHCHFCCWLGKQYSLTHSATEGGVLSGVDA